MCNIATRMCDPTWDLYRCRLSPQAHYDNRAGSVHLRAATFMVYLADTPAGGATFFPRSPGPPCKGLASDLSEKGVIQHRNSPAGPGGAAPLVSPIAAHLPPGPAAVKGTAGPGLRVFPKKGRAILFWSRLPDGTEDVASIHAGEEVQAGSKWIITRWLREVDE